MPSRPSQPPLPSRPWPPSQPPLASRSSPPSPPSLPALPALPSIPTVGGRNPCFDHSCSQCCHDIEMLLTNADLARLRAARPDLGDSFWFEADDGYLQLRTRDGAPARGSGWTPGLTKDGEPVPPPRPCVFLADDGRCSVFDARPEGCRLYPAMWEDAIRAAEFDVHYCPHTDGFEITRAVDDAVRQLAERLADESRDRELRRRGIGRPR